MSLEAVTYINDLDVANPPGTDNILQGDDHIRNIKTALKNVFPNADKAWYLPDYVSKSADYTIVLADINKFLAVDSSAATRTMTLPTLGASNDGWAIWIWKESASNDAIISGTINGVANLTLGAQYQTAYIWWTGTAWRAIVSAPHVTYLTAETTPAVDDNFLLWDTSSSNQPKKITSANLFKIINVLTAETDPASDDKIAIYDTSGSSADGMTLANMLKVVNGLTEDTAPAWSTDYFLTYDASATAAKKVIGTQVNPFGSQLLHVRDEKASGTDGGNFTSGAWQTRTLNTVKTNEITGASLASNQITLPAGTYFIRARAPALGNASHTAKLRNVSDGSDTIIGSAEWSDGSDVTSNASWVEGRFTIAAEKVFQLQHQTQSTRNTTGFGAASGFGVVEVYAEVMIWKVA